MITADEHDAEAQKFYRDVLGHLQQSSEPFMIGGGFAFYHYTGIRRQTKDLDIFCKASQCPRLLQFFNDAGYVTEWTDVRWLAKVFSGPHFMDIIFDSPNNICSVDDSWYEHAVDAEFHGLPVRIMPAEELIWCKLYVQNRERYDGADVNHLLLHCGKTLDWQRLMRRVDRHWHLLLAQFILFQFVYPTDYKEILPKEMFDLLMERARQQYEVSSSVEKICRGPLIDQTQYAGDVINEHYKAMTIKTI
ncbi:MAG TPA: nucleotidyltransferase [Puia sp.]